MNTVNCRVCGLLYSKAMLYRTTGDWGKTLKGAKVNVAWYGEYFGLKIIVSLTAEYDRSPKKD